jgi:hypothetical protein
MHHLTDESDETLLQNIVRINICCLNSALFFIGTWILFYAIVLVLFFGIFLGAATLLGVK